MSTLVAVFAHPDDETFICGGGLAKAFADGHRVVLVCATKGEMGRRMGIPPTATRESIAVVREKELRDACAQLHIDTLHFLLMRDKSLEIQPLDELVDRILMHLRTEKPQSVLTFHEKLGGHPDHCTIGKATTLAFATYKKENPQANLIFVAWPAFAKDPKKHGLVADQLFKVDISGQLQQKLQAFRAHKTQSDMNEWVWKDDVLAISSLDTFEWFIQAKEPFHQGKTALI